MVASKRKARQEPQDSNPSSSSSPSASTATSSKAVKPSSSSPSPPPSSTSSSSSSSSSPPSSSSTPVTLHQWLTAHEHEIERLDNGKIRCTLTGIDLPAKLDALQSYFQGKGVRRAREAKEMAALDLELHEHPFLIEHKRDAQRIYCTLTRVTLNRIASQIRAHMAGVHYQSELKKHVQREARRQELVALREAKAARALEARKLHAQKQMEAEEAGAGEAEEEEEKKSASSRKRTRARNTEEEADDDTLDGVFDRLPAHLVEDHEGEDELEQLEQEANEDRDVQDDDEEDEQEEADDDRMQDDEDEEEDDLQSFTRATSKRGVVRHLDEEEADMPIVRSAALSESRKHKRGGKQRTVEEDGDQEMEAVDEAVVATKATELPKKKSKKEKKESKKGKKEAKKEKEGKQENKEEKEATPVQDSTAASPKPSAAKHEELKGQGKSKRAQARAAKRAAAAIASPAAPDASSAVASSPSPAEAVKKSKKHKSSPRKKQKVEGAARG